MKTPPKILKAEEVTEPGPYWWRESPDQLDGWDIVEVGQVWPWEPKRFVILVAGEGKSLSGEFSGPIKMREV